MTFHRAFPCIGSPGAALLCVASLGVTLSTSCASLTDIEKNECGNGVIEVAAQEDCDLHADPTLGPNTACGQPTASAQQRCRYVCTDDFTCPQGWSCNRDSVCQYGSGGFNEAPSSPVQLLSQTLQLGDVDGDSNLDLIGFSENEVQLKFGDGNGQFASEFFFTSPAQSGQATFGQLDNDANYDALIPFDFGLVVLRGQTGQEMIAVAAVADLGDDGMPFPPQARGHQLQLPSADQEALARVTVFITDAPGTMPLQLHVFSREISNSTVLLPSRLPIRTIDNIVSIPTADVDVNVSRDGGDMVVAFTGDDRVFVVGVTGTRVPDTMELELRAEVLLPPGHTMGSEVDIVHLNGDGTADLLIAAVDGAGEERVVVVPGQGDGTFQAAFVDTRFDKLLTDCEQDAMAGIGEREACRRFPAGVGDLDRDLVADFVAPNRVYLAPTSVAELVPATDRFSVSPWTDAIVADFNSDGHIDIAAVSDDNIGVDFMMGDSSGFFTPVRMATSGTPFSLRLGDFDGDFVNDLAFAESLSQEDAVSVIFGESDGPPTRTVTIGRFPQVNYCEVGRSSGTPDLIDDLFVDSSDDDQVAVSQFFGTSQRRLVSPFSFGPPDQREAVNAVLFGRFSSTGDSGVMALTNANADPNAGGEGRRPRFFVLDNVSGGESPEVSDEVPVMDIQAGSLQQFGLDCALWAAGDIDDDGLDEIVAIDQTEECRRGMMEPGAPRLLILDLVEMGPGRVFRPTLVDLPGGLRVPGEIALVDVDPPDLTDPEAVGDGLDLVVTFAGDQVASNGCVSGGSSGVIVYWGASGTDRTVVSGLGTTTIPSTAVANLDNDVAGELAIWTSDGIHIADLDENRALAASLSDIDTLVSCDGQIAAGDFDQDNIADLAVSDESSVELYFSIPHTRADITVPEPVEM